MNHVRAHLNPPRLKLGEVPILDPMDDDSIDDVLATMAGLDEGLTLPAGGSWEDDMSPETLLGDHREGR